MADEALNRAQTPTNNRPERPDRPAGIAAFSSFPPGHLHHPGTSTSSTTSSTSTNSTTSSTGTSSNSSSSSILVTTGGNSGSPSNRSRDRNERTIVGRSGHEGGFVQPSSYLRQRPLSHPMTPAQPERAIDRDERLALVSPFPPKLSPCPFSSSSPRHLIMSSRERCVDQFKILSPV
jgi:hypothetical protein